MLFLPHTIWNGTAGDGYGVHSNTVKLFAGTERGASAPSPVSTWVADCGLIRVGSAGGFAPFKSLELIVVCLTVPAKGNPLKTRSTVSAADDANRIYVTDSLPTCADVDAAPGAEMVAPTAWPAQLLAII